MEENRKNILVFATDIKTKMEKKQITTPLNDLAAIEEWNIDQKDVDCVLRIVSQSITAEEVIKLINELGFNCAELP